MAKYQDNNLLSRDSLDPRADKFEDHDRWEDLLWNCWNLEKDLYYLLHGVRSGGAEVMLTKSSFQLLQGEWSAADWDDIRQSRLSPFRESLVNIFKLTRVGKVTNEKLPVGLFG